MPKLILMGNKVDLNHMQAVKLDQHNEFAKDHDMKSTCYVSAKTGDNLALAFLETAASLAGVQLTSAQLEAYQGTVKAGIVKENREGSGKEVNLGAAVETDQNNESKQKEKKKNICAIF